MTQDTQALTLRYWKLSRRCYGKDNNNGIITVGEALEESIEIQNQLQPQSRLSRAIQELHHWIVYDQPEIETA